MFKANSAILNALLTLLNERLFDNGNQRLRVPLLLRRVITLVPALIVLGVGFDPTRALVLSQVLLSVGIPFALVPLVSCTQNRQLMGAFANGPVVRWASWLVTVLIVVLNVVLIALTVTG